MNNLENWDFLSAALNETRQQINRQKSAINQTLVDLDPEAQSAVFLNERDSAEILTTLGSCTCHDFSYCGATGRRRKFLPCKHIYRLCFELGVLKPKFYDAKAELKMWNEKSPEERRAIALQQMQAYPQDPNRWGDWNESIHHHYSQIARQHRAYSITEEFSERPLNQSPCDIHGYAVTLQTCTCPDFAERKLPCKHIYCMAIMAGHPIPLSEREFQTQARDGAEFARALFGFVFSVAKPSAPQTTTDQADGKAVRL